MKTVSRSRWVAVLGGGLMLLTAACRSRNAPEAPSRTALLETAAVERRSSPEIREVDGVVIGRLEAVLSSRLSARVASVAAIPGREAAAGTVLVRLDSAEAEAALAGARANLAASRAALDLATKNRERFEQLESRGAVAALDADRIRQDQASASAAVATAEAASRRAEADRAQALLAAPFDSIVVEKMVSPGDLAASGRPLVRLASRTGRRVEASPAEADAALIAPGDAVEVVLGDRVIVGTVAEVVAAVDPATRRRMVRVDLPAGIEPAVGSFVRLRLAGPPAPRLVAPRRAVVARGGLEIAWIVGADRKVSLRYIRTGPPSADGGIEIRAGLEAGERIVLDPPATLEEGTRLRL